MATRNFYQRNADRLFVYEQPDEENYYDDWFEGATNDLHDVALDCHFVPCYSEHWNEGIERSANNLHDYYASALYCYFEQGVLDKYNNKWKVTLVPLLRSGYYADACLDYYIEVECGYWETLKNEDAYSTETLKSVIADYLGYQRDCRDEDVQEGEGTELLKLVDDMIAKAVEKFYEFAEESGLEEYICGGQFSNGEAVFLNKTELEKRALKKG